MDTPAENKSNQPEFTKTRGTESSGPTYRYSGDGHTFVMGLPAKDLSADDVAALSDEQRDLLDEHSSDNGLYSKGDK